MTAETVACTLFDNVICRFGCPDTIHSDQGAQFMSAVFKHLCSFLHIEQSRTTGYHPQGDGLVERLNRTLLGILRRYVSTSATDWDLCLQSALMAICSSVHASSGFSPHLSLLGREMQLPLHLVLVSVQGPRVPCLSLWLAFAINCNKSTLNCGSTISKLLMCSNIFTMSEPSHESINPVTRYTCLLLMSGLVFLQSFIVTGNQVFRYFAKYSR